MRKYGYKYEKIDSYINNWEIEWEREWNIHGNEIIGCTIYDHWSLKSLIFYATVICFVLFICLIIYTNTYYGFENQILLLYTLLS